MIPVSYSNPPEQTSPRWAQAFAKGCGGEVCEVDELQPGPVAMFGSPARWGILQRAIQQGREWFYGDHAYFGRKRFFRITKGAYQHTGAGEGDAQRFDALGVKVQPWKTDGAHIVLCPNSPAHFAMHGQDAQKWLADTTAELRKFTDRPIEVRWKTSPHPLEESLKGAWAVVVFSSVCGVHAAMAGVPCFATTRCASLAFGSDDLSLIESPVRPDNRYELGCVLAANQWELAEMQSGQAWASVTS